MDERPRVRRAAIDSLPAMVLDGLMSVEESTQLFQGLRFAPFTRSEFARPDMKAFMHWVRKVDVAECRRMPLYDATLRAVRTYFPELGAQRCYRSYCNLSSFGDMLFTHTDTKPGMVGLTALWYIAPKWDIEWGGETLLFNAEGDAELAVTPKPGRLLLFDGRIRHAGRPPSRVCVIPRLTFALKLAPQDASWAPA